MAAVEELREKDFFGVALSLDGRGCEFAVLKSFDAPGDCWYCGDDVSLA